MTSFPFRGLSEGRHDLVDSADTTGSDTLHEYRVVVSDTGERGVYATVDRQAQTITLDVPEVDGATVRMTVDVVTGRAIYMAVSEAVYGSLDPCGPWLRIERASGGGWSTIGPSR